MLGLRGSCLAVRPGSAGRAGAGQRRGREGAAITVNPPAGNRPGNSSGSRRSDCADRPPVAACWTARSPDGRSPGRRHRPRPTEPRSGPAAERARAPAPATRTATPTTASTAPVSHDGNRPRPSRHHFGITTTDRERLVRRGEVARGDADVTSTTPTATARQRHGRTSPPRQSFVSQQRRARADGDATVAGDDHRDPDDRDSGAARQPQPAPVRARVDARDPLGYARPPPRTPAQLASFSLGAPRRRVDTPNARTPGPAPPAPGA